MLVEFDPPQEEGGEPRPRIAPIAADLTVKTAVGPEAETRFEAIQKNADQVARTRNTRIAAALHAAVAPDRATLVTRADAERACLSTDDAAELEAFVAGSKEPAPATLVRGAAIVRMAAEAPRKKAIASDS